MFKNYKSYPSSYNYNFELFFIFVHCKHNIASFSRIHTLVHISIIVISINVNYCYN